MGSTNSYARSSRGHSRSSSRIEGPYRDLSASIADANGVVVSSDLAHEQKTSLNEVLMAVNGLVQSLAIELGNILTEVYEKLQRMVDIVASMATFSEIVDNRTRASQLGIFQDRVSNLSPSLSSKSYELELDKRLLTKNADGFYGNSKVSDYKTAELERNTVVPEIDNRNLQQTELPEFDSVFESRRGLLDRGGEPADRVSEFANRVLEFDSGNRQRISPFNSKTENPPFKTDNSLDSRNRTSPFHRNTLPLNRNTVLPFTQNTQAALPFRALHKPDNSPDQTVRIHSDSEFDDDDDQFARAQYGSSTTSTVSGYPLLQ